MLLLEADDDSSSAFIDISRVASIYLVSKVSIQTGCAEAARCLALCVEYVTRRRKYRAFQCINYLCSASLNRLH